MRSQGREKGDLAHCPPCPAQVAPPAPTPAVAAMQGGPRCELTDHLRVWLQALVPT